MSDLTATVGVVVICIILMVIPPLVIMANKQDDVATVSISTYVTETTNEIKTTGRITEEMYTNLAQMLAATGNSYKIEITIQELDENPAKKNTSVRQTIGNNVYITHYTSEIVDSLPYQLKEGDIITLSVENTNLTIGQQLSNFVFRLAGNSQASIVASASGIVMADGNHN